MVKKILISLDLTVMDSHLMQFAAYLVDHLPLEKVYFMHAIELDPDHAALSSILPEQEGQLETVIREEIIEKLAQYFTPQSPIDTEVSVLEGDPTPIILDWARSEAVDLMVLGKKSHYRGSGIFSGKIARLAQTGVLFVPETNRDRIRQILVPTDFSPYAQVALEQALYWSKLTGAKIRCQHVVHLPVHYFPVIRSEEKVRKEVLDHARKSYQRFLKKIKLDAEDIPCHYTIDDGAGIATHIHAHALAIQADLMIMGSKGRTDAGAFLMGSVAERLSNYDLQIPLMVVKHKKKAASLLDALLKR